MYKRIFYFSMLFSFFILHNISSRDIVDVLVEYRESEWYLQTNHASPLYWAVANKDEEAVNLLLAQGTDIETRCYAEPIKTLTNPFTTYTSLGLAVDLNYINIVSILCHNGANPNEPMPRRSYYYFTDKSSLYKFLTRLTKISTIRSNQYNYTRSAIDNKYCTPCQPRSTVFFEAICLGRTEIVEIFASSGFSLEKPCIMYLFDKGLTPLQVAMIMEEEEVIKILLKHGARVSYSPYAKNKLKKEN